MALTPENESMFDCHVTGTNHHRDVYDTWRSDGCPQNLKLRRVKDNPHDANAVAVMYGNGQIGWVGKAYAQIVGPKMDAGMRYRIRTLAHYPNADPMIKLHVRLEPVEQIKKAQRWILGFSGHIGRPAGTEPLWRGESGKFKLGTVLALCTTRSRTSVDLVDTDGRKIAWIRKEEVSGWEDHDLDGLWREYLFWVNPHGAMALLPSERMPEGWLVSSLKDNIIHPDVALVTIDTNTIDTNTITNGTIRADKTTTKKENTMNNLFSRLIDTNKRLATTAAVLEAGRIANNTVANFLINRLSFLERFVNRKHINSPLAKLLVANGALALAQQVRPNDSRVRSLTEAMATQAYQEVYQQVDIEGLIDGLLNSAEIKRAMSKLDDKPKAE